MAFAHFPLASFTWVKGEPMRYRSSRYAEHGFCSICGSTLTMYEEVLSDRVQVAVGSLDQPQRVRPDDHVWTQDQLPWFEINDGLPHFRQNSSAVPSKAVDDNTA
jgi:hypothetical protein